MKASDLEVRECPALEAVAFNASVHSRLPHVQQSPWMHIWGAYTPSGLVGVMFWHNTSARNLPQSWCELRRMAVSEDAPTHTASFMLGWARRWFMREKPGVTRLVSYQDLSVHDGTIYKAAGWVPAYISRPRKRDRSGTRKGTSRQYRTDANGKAPAASAKVRWEMPLDGEEVEPITDEMIEKAKRMKPTL